MCRPCTKAVVHEPWTCQCRTVRAVCEVREAEGGKVTGEVLVPGGAHKLSLRNYYSPWRISPTAVTTSAPRTESRHG
ncbi:hypothetical protein Acsp06_56320 [Actinomycetospora sp. NBRC 106375]|nr:hypothetical protein Acsp06_56320 [Actinomycetospora sp. NBRC 106375]